MTEEEKKYKNVISALKSLPKVKAKDDFDQKLYRKLRDADSERMSPSFEKLTKHAEKNWIFNIFRPAFVPAVALTLILFIFIVVYIYFKPYQDTTSISQNQQEEQKQELIIKKPGITEDKDLSANRESEPPVTHELSKSEYDERTLAPVSPKSDVGTESPYIQPEEKLSQPPEIEQRIEKKAPAIDELKEKELKLEKKGERKTGDLKKNEELNKIEEQNQQKNADDVILNGVVKPSMGMEKTRAKDSVKTDSVKSKKETGKESDKNGVDTDEKKNETEKQAEPKQQIPTEEKK